MNEITQIGSGEDVVSFLKSQHQQIKAGFEHVLAASGEERKQAFMHLRQLMAVHETAEEEVVHPVARKALAAGEGLIQQRLDEENEAKKVLTELEHLDVSSIEFETKFNTLNQAVLKHAEAEESTEFDVLKNKLDEDKLLRMGRAFAFAEKVAPTRAHAGVESQAANLLAGPFLAMVDRVRDALNKPSQKDNTRDARP